MSEQIVFAAPYKVYKSNSAAQFMVIKPRVENGKVVKEGAILLEASKASGNKSYDWKNKISFAIGIQDLKLLFSDVMSPPRLVHQTPNSPLMKSLEFQPGTCKYEGTYMLKLGQKNSSTNDTSLITVPLTGGEKDLLFRMMDKFTLNMLGWVS